MDRPPTESSTMGIIDANMTFPDHRPAIDGGTVRVLLSPAEGSALRALEPRVEGYRLLMEQSLGETVIGDELVRDADIVLVEVNPADTAAISRLADLRARYPELPVIAVVADARLHSVRALMKLGVSDILEMPLSVPALASSIRDVDMTLASSRMSKERSGGAMISVIKSIGGVGATNVAAHLADTLARTPGLGGACLFDLDVQFGNVASYMGVPSSPSLSDLLSAGSRIDGDFLQSVATSLPDGLAVFPAPTQIGPLEAVDQDQLLNVLEAARRQYGAVVADMPSNWSNWTLSVVAQSTLVVLVVNLSIGSLRQGRRQLELLMSQGIRSDRIRVVANRVEKRLFHSIGLEDAARALGVPVDYTIQNDYPLVNGANDRGVLIHKANAKSKIAREFEQIGAAVAAALPAKVS